MPKPSAPVLPQGPSGDTSSEAIRVREIIEATNVALTRGYASGEIDAVAAIYAEDAWQLPPHSPPLVGREAIRGFWRDALARGAWEFTLQTQQVSVCGPMAVERGTYLVRFSAGPTAAPDDGSWHDRGNYLVYWRREDDGVWRIVGGAPVSELARHGARYASS